MASISGPFTPADGAAVSTPFNQTVEGVSPAASLVELRGENGLLVPATLNPKMSSSGSVTFENITSFIGNKGANYSVGGAVIEAPAAPSFSLVSQVNGTRKGWSTTRTYTLPQLTLSGGYQKAALCLMIEDTATGHGDFSFTSLGFTPTAMSSKASPVESGGGVYWFWCAPGDGTYNGTATLSGTGNCAIVGAWFIFESAGTPSSRANIDEAATSTRPTQNASFSSGSIALAGVANVGSAASGTANNVAAGDSDDCTILFSNTADTPGTWVVRINGTVSAGTHDIGMRSPASADWAFCILEVPPA